MAAPRVRSSIAKLRTKNYGYNSRLQKGGALLEDMRLLVRAWHEGDLKEQTNVALIENLLGKQTRARALDTLRRAFIPRFVDGHPRDAWKIVRALEDHNLPIEILRPVYYWITARNEPILYDFVCSEILHRSKSQSRSVDVNDVSLWLTQRLSKADKVWSSSVTLKVARGMLASLRDFGILEGASKKTIAPVYIPVESFAYIAFALSREGAGGITLHNHQDWTLFLFSQPAIERMFIEADRHGLLRYQAAGKLVRIDFPKDTWEGMANVFAGRTY
jgi:hypothetical protein